ARRAAALGQPELATAPRFSDHEARGVHQDERDRIIGAWAAVRPAAQIIDELTAAEVVVGPVATVEDVFADPQFAARDMIVDHPDPRVDTPVRGPGEVPVLSDTPGGVRTAGPITPGQGTDEVRARPLGHDAEPLAAPRA